MFKSPMLRKTVVVILGAVLVSLLFSGLFIHFALKQQFDTYLSRTEKLRRKEVLNTMAGIYQEGEGWNTIPYLLGCRQGSWGDLYFVTDMSGRIVVQIHHGGTPLVGKILFEEPVLVDEVQVGTAHFGRNPVSEMLALQDERFRTAIYRSIIWAGVVTGLLALVVALYLARRLTRPIGAMNRIAKEMAAGRLDRRVGNLSRDEIGELGESLNDLAEQLRRLEERRKQMAADVAHDLRTPLATVKSHLEGMIDAVILPSQENLESLLEEINRLTCLVGDLQEIARTDAEIRRFNFETIPLEGFLDEMWRKFLPLYQEKGVELVKPQFPGITIKSDRGALGKIIDNLLSNALKFTPAGKCVALGAWKDQNSVAVMVRDEGVGISLEDLPFIFERFYRTDHSRNRQSGGFGLGLAIVKDLTEALGGRVEVKSRLGEGSTFTIWLPGEDFHHTRRTNI